MIKRDFKTSFIKKTLTEKMSVNDHYEETQASRIVWFIIRC